MMNNRLVGLLASLAVACPLIGAAGCHDDHPGPPPRAVVVAPGYYYDREYVDVAGHPHPRAWYYYDGHDYVPHGPPPPNVEVHERVVHVERPGDYHGGDVPGERLHDQIGPDDRAGQLPPY